jgi:hypothetical protein
MCDRQHRESHAPLPGYTASAQRQTDAVEARMQYEEPGQEREEDRRRSLHSLQECICELLIRNKNSECCCWTQQQTANPGRLTNE